MSYGPTEFGATRLPPAINEAVRAYAPGSVERAKLKAALKAMASECIDIPSVVGGSRLMSARQANVVMPHDHQKIIGVAHVCDAGDVKAAIEAAGWASRSWSKTSPKERAAIFLKAAELLAGPWRDRLNAATMLGQSKTAYQAEIDSAAELIDFLRFNVHFMEQIYADQPISGGGAWNRVDYRPLEGFILAITPFNFTAIAGNLPCAPALMGNTIVWKPAQTALRSAHEIMALLEAAGLPRGVINMINGDGAMVANVALTHPSLAGVHFTGSTPVFDSILQRVATGKFSNYPRVVGETGGKNFVIAHPSADFEAVATGVLRGAFEYQGQKCSAASRIFIPRSRWLALKQRLCDEIATIRVGDVQDFSNFMGAVIDQRAFDRLSGAIAKGKQESGTKLLAGGTCDNSAGYFVSPTLFETEQPTSHLMTDELFGPIATVMTYDDTSFEAVLSSINAASVYGLTGAIFATDRDAISRAVDELRYAAGNLYINDKPTGAVVGQQPFGGARASGTNDKAGSLWNLMRWVSPRTLKENFVPPTDYRYPFLGEA